MFDSRLSEKGPNPQFHSARVKGIPPPSHRGFERHDFGQNLRLETRYLLIGRPKLFVLIYRGGGGASMVALVPAPWEGFPRLFRGFRGFPETPGEGGREGPMTYCAFAAFPLRFFRPSHFQFDQKKSFLIFFLMMNFFDFHN